MDFIHSKVVAGPQNIIQVDLDTAANVRFMDSLNFQKYRLKKQYDFAGGLYTTSPVEFRPPHRNEWHVVVDLEGLSGIVKAIVKVLQV